MKIIIAALALAAANVSWAQLECVDAQDYRPIEYGRYSATISGPRSIYANLDGQFVKVPKENEDEIWELLDNCAACNVRFAFAGIGNPLSSGHDEYAEAWVSLSSGSMMFAYPDRSAWAFAGFKSWTNDVHHDFDFKPRAGGCSTAPQVSGKGWMCVEYEPEQDVFLVSSTGVPFYASTGHLDDILTNHNDGRCTPATALPSRWREIEHSQWVSHNNRCLLTAVPSVGMDDVETSPFWLNPSTGMVIKRWDAAMYLERGYGVSKVGTSRSCGVFPALLEDNHNLSLGGEFRLSRAQPLR